MNKTCILIILILTSFTCFGMNSYGPLWDARAKVTLADGEYYIRCYVDFSYIETSPETRKILHEKFKEEFGIAIKELTSVGGTEDEIKLFLKDKIQNGIIPEVVPSGVKYEICEISISILGPNEFWPDPELEERQRMFTNIILFALPGIEFLILWWGLSKNLIRKWILFPAAYIFFIPSLIFVFVPSAWTVYLAPDFFETLSIMTRIKDKALFSSPVFFLLLILLKSIILRNLCLKTQSSDGQVLSFKKVYFSVFVSTLLPWMIGFSGIAYFKTT